MISDLTQKRIDDTMRFIEGFQKKEGIFPIIREIQAHLELSSTSTAYKVVKGLMKLGWIVSKRNSPRTIIITRRKEPTGEHNYG